MQEPIVKRVNTISLKFTTGIRNNKACEYILGQVLGLKRNDVKSLGYVGLPSVYVKLSSYDLYSIRSSETSKIFMKFGHHNISA